MKENNLWKCKDKENYLFFQFLMEKLFFLKNRTLILNLNLYVRWTERIQRQKEKRKINERCDVKRRDKGKNKKEITIKPEFINCK